MAKITLYGHNGSKNHGCEAIVRGTEKIIRNNYTNINILTQNKEADVEFKLNEIASLTQVNTVNINKKSLKYIIAAIKYKLFNNKLSFEEIRNKEYENLFNGSSISMSIGGDNYCYDKPRWLFYLNKLAKDSGSKTVLWGCSIEPKHMDKEMIEDLKQYDLIVARESITYDALIKNGVNKNTKLYPDPAFQLEKVDIELPSGFKVNDTIGINLSPLIIKCETNEGATFDNFVNLVKHILDTTTSNVALIPHVTWSNNNDAQPLENLYEMFKHTNRVVLVGTNYNAMELKGIISKCRMFIGARTHATIAAYSTCVPTLVVGYSVKAKGIARDIFGSDENMVIPVQVLENKNDLVNAFEYIRENEENIRQHLLDFIPGYKRKALLAREEIKSLI